MITNVRNKLTTIELQFIYMMHLSFRKKELGWDYKPLDPCPISQQVPEEV